MGYEATITGGVCTDARAHRVTSSMLSELSRSVNSQGKREKQ